MGCRQRALPRSHATQHDLAMSDLATEDGTAAAASPPAAPPLPAPSLLPAPREGGLGDGDTPADDNNDPALNQDEPAASRFGHRFLVQRIPDFLRHSGSRIRRLSASVARRVSISAQPFPRRRPTLEDDAASQESSVVSVSSG